MRDLACLSCTMAALLAATPAAAQTFKCVDGAGKTTYSSTRCADLGLKDSGEVRDRLNVSPAYKPPAVAPSAPPKNSAAPSAVPSALPQNAAPTGPPGVAAQGSPAEADRRCFTVKTPTGTSTRCNEKQD